MLPLTAEQLVYTNVEAEDSPHKKRGDQILCCTTDLPDSDRRFVEQRLFYPPGLELDKHVFFPLGADRLVLARIVSLPEPDRFNRRGRALHC